MVVYVLCSVIQYEGEYALGVYSSREAAVAASEAFDEADADGIASSFDGFAIYEFPLDGAATEPFAAMAGGLISR